MSYVGSPKFLHLGKNNVCCGCGDFELFFRTGEIHRRQGVHNEFDNWWAIILDPLVDDASDGDRNNA